MTSAWEPFQRLQAQLPDEVWRALDAARIIARRLNVDLFLVGGACRDLLLGRPLKDIDLALESDPEELVRPLVAIVGGRAVRHARFGTATLYIGRSQLDFARTR